MHKFSIIIGLFLLILPLGLMAQITLDLGIKSKNGIIFQRNMTSYFDKNWSVDIAPAIGAEVTLSYDAIGLGIGMYGSRLGFNKNNPDTANSFFVPRSRARTYIFEQIKYRAAYREIPLSVHYKIRFRKLTLKPGLGYSFYTLHKSYIHKALYYDYNIIGETEVEKAKDFLREGAKNRFNAFMGFCEIEYNVASFSFSFRLSLNKLEESYHQAIDNKPLVVSSTLGVQYYFLSQPK